MVKNPPAMQETWVWSLGWEDLLEKGRSNPPQDSDLEISMDRGPWQATVHGVAKSRVRTEWLWLHLMKSILQPITSEREVILNSYMGPILLSIIMYFRGSDSFTALNVIQCPWLSSCRPFGIPPPPPRPDPQCGITYTRPCVTVIQGMTILEALGDREVGLSPGQRPMGSGPGNWGWAPTPYWAVACIPEHLWKDRSNRTRAANFSRAPRVLPQLFKLFTDNS